MAIKGKNLYGTNESYSSNTLNKDICIFVSHISKDKAAAQHIANFITESGFNVYLDINDPELQRAVDIDNAEYITMCIEKGITKSSHILCLLSENTKTSWWVPYEVGFGKKGGKEIATLALKNTTDIPSYLKITENLQGIVSLHKYLNKLSKGSYKYEMLSESSYHYNHQLDSYLKNFK